MDALSIIIFTHNHQFFAIINFVSSISTAVIGNRDINFEAIIGGADNPRFTAPIETDSGDVENPSLVGQKTEIVSTGLQGAIDSFTNQKIQLAQITQKASKFLSNNQFIN